ncbi:MAG: STAS domain-containing protein [Candidatus Sericytochromatia bacterium]
MEIRISRHQFPDVTVLTLIGSLPKGHALEQAVFALLEQPRNLVVDISGLAALEVACLGELLKQLNRLGQGRLILVQAQQQSQRPRAGSRTFSTLEDALKALSLEQARQQALFGDWPLVFSGGTC